MTSTIPIVAATGKKAANTIGEALTADLAVVRYRTKGSKQMQPVDLELHLNPAALGVAAVGAGLALWLMQLRVGLTEAFERHWGKWMWANGSPASELKYYDLHPTSTSGTYLIHKDSRGMPPTREGYWVESWASTEFIPANTGETEAQVLASIGHGPPFTTEELIRIKAASGVVGAGAGGYGGAAGYWADIVHPRYWVAQPETAWWKDWPDMVEQHSAGFGITERKGFSPTGGLI